MSRERQVQWAKRLERLQTLRERFTAAHHFEKAYKAYCTIQHVYDRWADEVFCAPR